MLFCRARVKQGKCVGPSLSCCNYFIRNCVQVEGGDGAAGDVDLPREPDCQAAGRVFGGLDVDNQLPCLDCSVCGQRSRVRLAGCTYDRERLRLEMVYGLIGGDLRRQTVQRSLETIRVGNAVAGKPDELPVTTKADRETAEVSAQWITKRSLLVTSYLDARRLVSSFDERQLIRIGSD